MSKYSQYVYTDELKRERKKKGLSIMDMSKLLGFKSKVTYYNIENGISEPKISNINDISTILGKSADNFFNFEVQKNWIKLTKKKLISNRVKSLMLKILKRMGNE